MGTIPTNVNSMTSIHTFSLHHHVGQKNELTGTLPLFQNMPKIREVYLDGNGLTGTIPHKFLDDASTSSDYIHIGLSYNKLSGTVPPELERFSSLQLNLVGNQITHLPQRFCKFKNWMAGTVEQYGCDAILCPNGTYNNDGRQINDEDPCWPCADGSGSPYLGATSCNEEGGASIVQILHEFYNAVRGAQWKKKSGWDQFETVTADNLDWASVAPCSFHGIDCVFNTIHGIDLNDNGLVGIIPSSLFQLPDLTKLDVSRNAVVMNHKGFKALGEHGLVTELNIASTRTKSLDGVGLLDSVRILDIGGLNLNLGEPIPQELFDLASINEIL